MSGDAGQKARWDAYWKALYAEPSIEFFAAWFISFGFVAGFLLGVATDRWLL